MKYRGLVRTGEIVVRDPNGAPAAGKPQFQVTPWSVDGDSTVAFGVKAVGSASATPIALYAYNCDAGGDLATPIDTVYSDTPDNSQVACTYAGDQVPSEGSPARTLRLTLTIFDANGQPTTTNVCSPGVGPGSVTTVIDSNPCTIRIAPKGPVEPEAGTPPPPDIEPPAIDPPVTTGPPPSGPPRNKVTSFVHSNVSGCCDTWAKFTFANIAHVEQYKVTLVWYLNSSASFTQYFNVPPGTPDNALVTIKFKQIGLSLLEKYRISIQARVNGTWQDPVYIRNGKTTCLSNNWFTVFGTEFCLLA